MSERRGVTFERLDRMKREYADDDDVLDVVHAVEQLANESKQLFTREQVGEYQAREARLISEPLRRQVEDLQRQLAEAAGQIEAAKQATREIMAERNTWARQLADAMDERQTALDEVDKARELASIASNDRDSLHIAVEELAQDYTNNKHAVYHRGDSVARDIRRVIARWETI